MDDKGAGDTGVDDGAAAPAPAPTSSRKAAVDRAADRNNDRIGARLAAARVAAKIDLVDIARETRVPLRHLRAIEADAHGELPALPYAVGFVKSLARSVGMDAEEAAARFRAETTIVPVAPMAASIEPLDERRLPSRGVVVASIAGLIVLLGGLTAYGAGWFDTTPPAVTAEAPATTTGTAPATVDPDAPLVNGDTSGVATPAAAVAVPTGPGVSIVAAEDAWIRIYRIVPETGRPQAVKTGLLAKGERYDVPADPPGLKLWTGRAGALQLSVDGRPVPALGGPAETVRNVSLDAAALRERIAAATSPATPAAPTASSATR